MPFTVQQVVDFARRRVFDTRAAERYSDAYYIDGLNQGISTMLEMKPELFGVAVNHQLAAGALQSIPATGTEFLEVTRNMGADGTSPGAVVRPVTRRDLDASDPGWTSATPSVTAIHYVPVAGSRTDFYVYPPQPAAPGYVELWMAEHPGLLTAVGETVAGVDDQYLAALGNYSAAFVLMTDDEDPSTTAKAEKFFQSFVALVGPPAEAANG